MVVEAGLPALGVVLTTAVIDSINPCAIGVLILLLSTLLIMRQSKSKMFLFSMTYIGAVFVTYVLAGLGLMVFLNSIPLVVAAYIGVGVASILTISGLIEIKDFLWYGKGFSLGIAPSMAKKINDYARRMTFPGLLFLGAFVAAVELPCTGGPYLAIIILLSQYFDLTALSLLLLYNLVFVLPLIVIVLIFLVGTKATEIKMWKQKYRSHMRLFTGLLLIGLSWLLILIANGTINFG
jgi:cytochrome c biogenesis protein CcdA